jgi:hypothetical protein
MVWSWAYKASGADAEVSPATGHDMKTRFHNFRSSLIPALTIQDYTGPHLGCQASAFSAQELEIARASHGNAIVITLNGAAFACAPTQIAGEKSPTNSQTVVGC